MRMSKRHQEQVSVTRKGGEQIYSRTHMEQLLKEMSILFAPLNPHSLCTNFENFFWSAT